MFGSTLTRLFTCTTGGLLLLQLACGSISSKSLGDGSAGTGGAETGGSAAGGGTADAGASGGSAGGAGGIASTGGAAGGSAGGALAGAGGSAMAGAGGTPGGGSHGGAAGGTAGATAGAGGAGGVKATGGAGGGSAGAGGSGPTCASLETDYTNAVNAAKSCTASGTCAVKISRTICGCSGCPSTTYISDASGPNAVKTQWQQLGCKCPLNILCLVCSNEPTSATCDSILLTAAAPIGGGGIIALPRTCTDH